MANKNHCHQLIVAIVTSLMVFGVYGQQSFDITPSATTGTVGDTVTLQCASSDKTGQLMWIRTGRLISRDTEVLLNADRYSITGDQSVGQYFLTISDLAIDDAGTYYCILSQSGGNAATSTPGVALTVIEPTDAPPQPPQSFRVEPQDSTVQVGGTLVLQCEIDNRAGDVLWFKNDVQQIISAGRVVIGDAFTDRYTVIGNEANGEYNLQIVNVEWTDAGTFVCFVDTLGNIPAITSMEARVTVTQAPTTITATTLQPTTAAPTTAAPTTISATTAAVTTAARQTTPGSRTTIHGVVTTVASPTEVTTKAATKPTTAPMTTGPVHMTTAPEQTTAGRTQQQQTTLSVVTTPTTAPPPQAFGQQPEDTTVQMGSTVVLYCQINNKAGDVQWIKEDNSLLISNERNIQAVALATRYSVTGDQSNGEYNLRISDVEASDSGRFTCHAEASGTVSPITSRTATLTVSEAKQIEVDILPETLKKRVEESGMFECTVESSEPVIRYVWSFDSEEIDVTSDNRFKLMANDTVLLIPNITKEMDESEVECTVTTANYTESATARIEIIADDEGLSSVSLAIVIAIIVVVIVVIIVSLVLFYCLWWKKRQEKYPLVTGNEQVIEEDTAAVAPTVASGNTDVLGGKQSDAVYKNGQLNAAYTVENEIPLSKSISLPPIRSHTPVGERPKTADLDFHREQPVYSKSKKSKKHKNKKKKRHNLIGPTELKPVKENGRQYSDKPRVLEHFVVESGSGDSPRQDTDSANSNKDVGNHHYETPQPLSSKSPKRSRRFEPDEDDERPRSPTPESHRPRSPTPDKQELRESERKHRRRRSVDDDDEDRHRDRPKSSKHRSRSSSEKRRHRRSRDETKEERRERHRRSRSRRNRDSRDFSDVSDAEHDVRRSNKELKTRESQHSPMDADDDREVRRSRRRGEKSRERHKHSRRSRDRHDSPQDD